MGDHHHVRFIVSISPDSSNLVVSVTQAASRDRENQDVISVTFPQRATPSMQILKYKEKGGIVVVAGNHLVEETETHILVRLLLLCSRLSASRRDAPIGHGRVSTHPLPSPQPWSPRQPQHRRRRRHRQQERQHHRRSRRWREDP